MRESRSAEERADSAVLESLTIAHDLADLYAAGIAPRHAEENNLQSIGKTRSELAATEARIATKLDGATAGRLRRLGEASEALANEVEQAPEQNPLPRFRPGTPMRVMRSRDSSNRCRRTIRGHGSVISGLSSIARVITERKRLEEELLLSQKMEAVGRLAGGIAHDFNNILTAVLGYSDLLITQIEERHWMWKNLHEIRKAAEFASTLTQRLLAFSRRQPLYPRVFCINASIARMEKMLQRVIGEHFKVRTVLGAKSGRLKADPGQVEQVLLNLCVNARDAMPKGGCSMRHPL